MGQILQDQTYEISGIMEGNKKREGKNRKKVKSRRTQIQNETKFKLEKYLSNSRRMRSKGIDRERSLVLIRRS